MRLTRRDWKTINDALALLEASADDEGLREAGEGEDAFAARLRRVREKVHSKLDGCSNPDP